MARSPRIVIVGLGYVGLPLAVALARKFDATGFDIDSGRVAELRRARDRTREVDEDDDLVIGTVAHRQYRELPVERLETLVAPGGTLADLKGMWTDRKPDPVIDRRTL